MPADCEGEDIDEALTWLSALQIQSLESYATLSHAGVRCFAELEQERISLEARQFIMFTVQ